MDNLTALIAVADDQPLRLDTTPSALEHPEFVLAPPMTQQRRFHLDAPLTVVASLHEPLVTSATGLLTFGRTASPNLVERAMRRLQALPKIVSESLDAGDDDLQQPLSVSAVRAATSVLKELAMNAPDGAIGVFPTENGGIALQVVGPSRTVSVEIAPDGAQMLAKYASSDVYHRESLRGGTREAVSFLSLHAR